MFFETLEPEDCLEHMLGEKGPFLSLFLSYGIPGKKDDRMRIDRKNTLNEAKKKLFNVSNPRWMNLLKEIDGDNAHKTKDPQVKGMPLTDVYFASEGRAFRTTLPTRLRPHFSFAAYAEIEPLVYFKWANEPFRLFKIDMERPRLLKGFGYQVTELELSIPVGLQHAFGSSMADFSFENVIALADRNRRPGTDLSKNDFFGYYGLSSRQNSHRDTNLGYWLMIVSEIFRENIDDRNIPNFVAGDGELCKRFVEINEEFAIKKDQILAPKIKDDERELVEQILHKILKGKFDDVSREMNELPYRDNLNEIVELLAARQIKKIFVQRDNWFAEDSANDGRYEYSNPRSMILADALRCRTPVEYTVSPIENKHGLAGVPY